MSDVRRYDSWPERNFEGSDTTAVEPWPDGRFVLYGDYQAEQDRANSYERAHIEIRQALGLTEHDAHELVLDTIKGNLLKLSSALAERDSYAHRLHSTLRALEVVMDFAREVDLAAAVNEYPEIREPLEVAKALPVEIASLCRTDSRRWVSLKPAKATLRRVNGLGLSEAQT